MAEGRAVHPDHQNRKFKTSVYNEIRHLYMRIIMGSENEQFTA